MAYDLLIKNGTIVDGTGAPRQVADIAVSNGRIAEIGKISGAANETIDAADCVVAPGFIDPHTHYDAQICWDRAITPSIWHGVTSVVMGNCGVGIAPCLPEAREIAMRDLVNVEAIPFDVLNAGITWDWQSFPEFLDAAAARGPALNLGFLAPLTPFRHYVMGEASMERAATADETAQIKALLREAVDAGAFGFSTTVLNQHMGYQARPLACRNADRAELKAYANVLKETGKGAIEIALTKKISVMDDDEHDLLSFLLAESGQPVTFLALFQRDDIPDACPETLRRAKALPGATPQTSPLALTREVNMRNPFSFAAFTSWARVFADQSKEAQRAVYADPAFRNHFREQLKNATGFSGDWGRITVHEAHKPEMKRHEGRTVADIAKERGKDGLDTFLDLTLEDDLDIEFVLAQFNANIKRVEENLVDPRVLIALGDAGAHVDMLCDAGYPTYLLGTWVRERQIMTLEQAVARLTSQPADLFGIKGRGRLKQGYAADIAIFDPATIGSASRGERRFDLPGGAKRMVMPARGVTHTIVNGQVAYADGQVTGSASGAVLRS
ncbi:MAG TPA: amidohydrolase family protein [Stellaceae bacterium]|jgi:N-acyl-D-aspartate/D-glutamate deacylase|nr:amidohydrolase family protein [Stellaceae bacterium]